MFEEIVPAVAAALSAQGSELVSTGTRAALNSLLDIVRSRFGRSAAQSAALNSALSDPGDLNSVGELAAHLRSEMSRDPEFAQRILAAWHGVTASGSAEGDAVVNTFSGQAQQVVQARTIRGGVKF
ncbi:hypothetical protein Asp14428_35420 [Actinoplanes sp. NBRC 14428]|nr:hypothetical protein Asp14428_35420 [Actinoplanes sp. NBRC 14428]